MKIQIKDIYDNVKSCLKQHSPEIFIGVGIASMVAATVTAVCSTPKVIALLEKKKETEEELKITEVIKTAAPCYIPSLILTVGGIGCIIGGLSTNIRKTTALATVYS